MHLSQVDNLRQGLDPPLPAWRPQTQATPWRISPVLQKTLGHCQGVASPPDPRPAAETQKTCFPKTSWGFAGSQPCLRVGALQEKGACKVLLIYSCSQGWVWPRPTWGQGQGQPTG